MYLLPCFSTMRSVAQTGFTALSLFLVSAVTFAQPETPSATHVAGRIDLESIDLPPATIEVNLSRHTFVSLFGLVDAAVDGVAASLRESADAVPQSNGTRLAAEQLEAGREIIELVSQVVNEVRVRIYQNVPDGLAVRCEQQLRDGNWETIVRGQDNGNTIRVCTLGDEEVVRGVFVIVGDGRELVLVNVACEVSPEKVRQITSTATKIGLENGLREMIEAKMKELHSHRASAPPGLSQIGRPVPESGNRNSETR